MRLADYFATNDGSLPEIEVAFVSPEGVVEAFEFLFSCGARDVTVGGASLWLRQREQGRALVGGDGGTRIAAGGAEGFHVVLADITSLGTILPDLGVFVDAESLVIDYRMGPEWGPAQVSALLALLRHFRMAGGRVAVPWWGVDGERAFLAAIDQTLS